MEQLAIGFGRLSAGQFDAMTPREVQWRIDALINSENIQFERLAQLACWLLNPWMKPGSRPIQVKDLLSRKASSNETDWDEWLQD